MLFILEMLLSYLIENKDKKIEASALNEMLEKYKEELEKEQEEDIIIKKQTTPQLFHHLAIVIRLKLK